MNDVEFLRVLIERVTKEKGIAPSNVFMVGFSNGGFMTQRFATEHPDLLAGVAVMSGTIGTKGNVLKPRTPVPMLLTHGMKDQRVRYDGGESPGDPEFDWASFATTVQAWKQANRCTDSTETITKTSTQLITVYNCEAPLTTIEYLDNGHVWDGWRLGNVWTRRPRASVKVNEFFDAV